MVKTFYSIKEKGFTQEQLGEKIGVTNKTVSRWENGNYMPPVECLTLLSEIYGVSINELVYGQRLDNEKLADAAEDNLKGALELNEQSYRKSEKILFIKSNFALGLLLIFLVAALAFISNTVNIVALILNKERIERKK